ncbi:MAG: YdjY domain-containing protein [Planctomycetota bacterium]
MTATPRHALAVLCLTLTLAAGCSPQKSSDAPPTTPPDQPATPLAAATASEPAPAPDPTPPPATETEPAAVTPPNDRPQAENVKPAATLPAGIVIDRENRRIELDATVVLREGWLELLACTPGTKEHESIVIVQTPPSVIHFALLTLGAEPGSPIRLERRGEELFAVPPTGAVVAIDITYDRGDERVTVPANQWVYNEATEAVMADNRWVFAGSKLREFDEGPVYLADLEGSAVSLVNFGSELLAKPNRLTDSNAVHGENFVVNTEVIPPLRTPVTLTLRLIDAPAVPTIPAITPSTAPATQPLTPPQTQPADPATP